MTEQQENNLQEKNEDELSHEFKNKLEGQKALDRLFKELGDKGLLVDPEHKSQTMKEMSDRLASLESEVSSLKDLIARAVKVNNVDVLKD